MVKKSKHGIDRNRIRNNIE